MNQVHDFPLFLPDILVVELNPGTGVQAFTACQAGDAILLVSKTRRLPYDKVCEGEKARWHF